jgi:hypothetical protein
LIGRRNALSTALLKRQNIRSTVSHPASRNLNHLIIEIDANNSTGWSNEICRLHRDRTGSRTKIKDALAGDQVRALDEGIDDRRKSLIPFLVIETRNPLPDTALPLATYLFLV